jgi:hypothetical protein
MVNLGEEFDADHGNETWNNLLQDAERAFAQQSPGVR